MGGATVLPWYTANASPISSASLTKSITNVADLSGWMRLSLDRVCTAASPVRVLSTYMAASLGWSKPVWNFSATTMICHWSVSNRAAVWDSPKPLARDSVSPSTSPENATSTPRP